MKGRLYPRPAPADALKTRVYRFLVTVAVEYDDTDSEPPAVEEMAEYIATQVQDEDDHNLAVCARAIEVQDFDGCAEDVPLTQRAE